MTNYWTLEIFYFSYVPLFLLRYDVEKESIRIHLVKPTQTEGKNGDGCPLARWVNLFIVIYFERSFKGLEIAQNKILYHMICEVIKKQRCKNRLIWSLITHENSHIK